MIDWTVIQGIDKAPVNHSKPFMVTRYRTSYLGIRSGSIYCALFKYYWQANLVSFYYHYISNYSCNTYKYNKAPVTAAYTKQS